MISSNILWLSLLQGITEFLPVSSSGHLILFSKLTNFSDQGNAMDVALHIGSVLAVIIYFSKDLWQMIKDLWKNKFMPIFNNDGTKIFYLLVIATIPSLFVGMMLKIHGVEFLRNTKLIGWNLIIFGILLWIFDHFSLTVMKIKNLKIKDSILIGFAQCLSLFPGTSRSGATITMCRLLGMERREAAKFSMLMAIPVILCAGFLTCIDIWKNQGLHSLLTYYDAITCSFLFSISAIYILMIWLKKWSFLPFVIYRILLGSLLLLNEYGIYQIKF